MDVPIPKNIPSFRRSGRSRILMNVILLITVAALLIFTIILVRIKLLQNAQSLGDSLVQSYAMEEERTIDSLEKQVQLISQYVDDIAAQGNSFDDVQAWLSDHFSKLIPITGEGVVDFYAVIDGKIVAANPREGDEGCDYMDTAWYRQAVEADGKVVCGEVYTDAITGERIFTISKALGTEGDVVAMDVYVQNPALHNMAHSLPEDCSYYLCDSDGALLYASAQWDADMVKLQSYADYMLAGIEDGSLVAYDASFTDMEGVSRGVYFHRMDNGWITLMTIPINSILMGERNTVVYFMAAAAVFLFVMIAMLTIQDALKSRRMRRTDNIASMLGDSFYAICRVNYENGTYEVFKSPGIGKQIPRRGEYERLLGLICSMVKPSTFRAFEENFSLDSIRQRIAHGVFDYGGDYQRNFDGVYRWVNIRTLHDPELTPNEVILCFRDVDEDRRRDLQHTIILQEALDAAQKSTKSKSEFFSRMSHDMRTPLNAIIGCCGLAEKSCAANDGKKTAEYLHKIDFASDQLLNLINDILELSRMEAGKHYLDLREIDLRGLLEKTADIFRDRAQTDGKTLEVSIDFAQPCIVGDEKKIIQILNNLLSNAVKYTNPGDTIRLEARQFDFGEHSKYQIVVEDTGIGMSPGFLDHLFDPYSRETAFSSRPAIGTGLGMAIVRSLVQQMSGEISVSSELGRGTRFTVTLPFKAAAGKPDAGPAPAARAEQPEQPDRPFDWKKRRILVAEDNELNREIVTELLQALGAQVITAVNGEEAVRVFRTCAPFAVDAILMDMQMPEMDGCQAASAIRALDRADAGVPIIAVTANAFAEDIDRTTKAGMNDHISKPIDSALLSEVLQKLITEWDAYRAKSGARKGQEEHK